jgi:hypothetical protein
MDGRRVMTIRQSKLCHYKQSKLCHYKVED